MRNAVVPFQKGQDLEEVGREIRGAASVANGEVAIDDAMEQIERGPIGAEGVGMGREQGAVLIARVSGEALRLMVREMGLLFPGSAELIALGVLKDAEEERHTPFEAIAHWAEGMTGGPIGNQGEGRVHAIPEDAEGGPECLAKFPPGWSRIGVRGLSAMFSGAMGKGMTVPAHGRREALFARSDAARWARDVDRREGIGEGPRSHGRRSASRARIPPWQGAGAQ